MLFCIFATHISVYICQHICMIKAAQLTPNRLHVDAVFERTHLLQHSHTYTLTHLHTHSLSHTEHTIKSAKLSGFSLFIDASTSTASEESVSRQAHREKFYLLHPCTASVRIGYDSPKAKFDLSRPRISLIATIPELKLAIQREELLCVVKV